MSNAGEKAAVGLGLTNKEKKVESAQPEAEVTFKAML